VGDLLFVSSCNGMARALEKKTGHVKWEYDTRRDGDALSFHGDPLITDDLIVIGTDGKSGHVYALGRSTGALRWKYDVPERGVASDVLRLGKNAYAVTLGDELLCLDLETGKPKWTFHSGFKGLDFPTTSSPALAGERIYFGGLDGIVYALDSQSGKVIWKKDLGARVTTSIALQGGSLYVGTAKRHLYRLDSSSGDVRADMGTESEPRGTIVVAGESMFVFLGEDVVASIDLSLKKVLWSAEASKEWTSSRPYVWRGAVLAGNRRELVALRLSDGAREWSKQFPEIVRGIGTSDEVLYVGSLKGPIFAYPAKP
jgi:outer membrane protein assembly factor BamB